MDESYRRAILLPCVELPVDFLVCGMARSGCRRSTNVVEVSETDGGGKPTAESEVEVDRRGLNPRPPPPSWHGTTTPTGQGVP